MLKKILLIIGILMVVGVALFLMFYSKPAGEGGESRIGFSIRDYLPFGSSGGGENVVPEEQEGDQNIIIPSDNTIPRLRKISGEPVAGAVIFNVGTTSVVRFVEKGTGNVYEARSDSNSVQRLTNTTIPKIIRAFWLPNGGGFLAQTIDQESEIIETSYIKLTKSINGSENESLTPFTTVISKLPTNIKEISIKPDGSKIFYYTAGRSSNWFVSNPDGTNSSLLLTHPLTEWIPKWISGNTILMQTKSSYQTAGYIYNFDISTKTLKKTGVGIAGLWANPKPDNSLILISGGGSSPNLYTTSNSDGSIKNVSVASLAGKCVWLNKEKTPSVFCAVPNQIPKGNYPDVWFKGLVLTEDSIEKIDLNNNIFYEIADLSKISKQAIDVMDPAVSPDDSHLIFRNKNDGYLWLLRIEE